MRLSAERQDAAMAELIDTPAARCPDRLRTRGLATKVYIADTMIAPKKGSNMVRSRAILTKKQVAAIRQRHSKGESIRAIAMDFEVSSTQIWNICTNRAWRSKKSKAKSK